MLRAITVGLLARLRLAVAAELAPLSFTRRWRLLIGLGRWLRILRLFTEARLEAG